MSEWFYSVDGVQYGPVSKEELQRFLREKTLAADDFVWNGAMPAWTEARKVPELTGGDPPFFPVGLPKLMVMYFGTFGVYQIYWKYKHWTTIRKRTGESMIPLARAIFQVFFFHLLVKEVNEEADARGLAERLPVGALTVLFVILTISWRLPDPVSLIAMLTIVPVAILQHRANALNALAAPLADPNTRIRAWNWLAAVLGLPFFAWVVWLTFTEV